MQQTRQKLKNQNITDGDNALGLKVLTEKNETSDKVLTIVMDLCKEVGVNIPDTIIDRAHRRGVAYIDNKSKKGCKNIIVHLTTFVTEPWSTRQRKT